MSLDSHAKISDIISSLQEFLGINEKDELKAALLNRGISSSDSDTMFQLIEKIQNIKLPQGNAVETDVKSGKTFTNADGVLRTGTATPDSLGGKNFASGTFSCISDGTGGYYVNININNLAFMPSTVIINTTSSVDPNWYPWAMIAISDKGGIAVDSKPDSGGSMSYAAYAPGNTDCNIRSNGFYINFPVEHNMSGTWKAYS